VQCSRKRPLLVYDPSDNACACVRARGGKREPSPARTRRAPVVDGHPQPAGHPRLPARDPHDPMWRTRRRLAIARASRHQASQADRVPCASGQRSAAGLVSVAGSLCVANKHDARETGTMPVVWVRGK
jgi:hypothetical protein